MTPALLSHTPPSSHDQTRSLTVPSAPPTSVPCTAPTVTALVGVSPVEQLGEEIALLASRIHAATYELLVLLLRFDEAAGWNNGFASCAHWLHWRTGIDLGAAREKVRVARALPDLPRVSAALQRGEVSYAKVRAITRVATPQNEGQLLDLALTTTAGQVERVVRAWRRCDRVAAAKQADARQLSRELRAFVDDDGMVVVHGRLTPEQGAVVLRALDAAADQLWRDGRDAAAPGTLVEETSVGQRRADALALVAEAALAGGLDRGTAGDRYQVVLHVDASAGRVDEAGRTVFGVAGQTDCATFGAAENHRALLAAADDIGHAAFAHATLECGDVAVDVSAETSARLSCDAAVVVMRHAANGSVLSSRGRATESAPGDLGTPLAFQRRALDVGRKTRTIPPSIRRALDARDAGCRFPGCTARRCDAHHVVHWAEGGATALDNLVLLCRQHHRLLHEGGYTVSFDDSQTATFVNASGRVVQAAPSLPAWSGPALLPATTAGPRQVLPTWDGTPFSVGDVIDVLRGHEPIATAHGL